MRQTNSANHSCTCNYSKPDSIETDHGGDCAQVIAAIEPGQCLGTPRCHGVGFFGHVIGCPCIARENQIRADIRKLPSVMP